MTTAEQEGGETALPRLNTATGGRIGRTSYSTLASGGGGVNGGYNMGYARGMSAQNQYRLPIIRQAENLDENRVVLYKASK